MDYLYIYLLNKFFKLNETLKTKNYGGLFQTKLFGVIDTI